MDETYVSSSYTESEIKEPIVDVGAGLSSDVYGASYLK